MHESPGVAGQPYVYKAVRTKDDKLHKRMFKENAMKWNEKIKRTKYFLIILLQLPVDEKKPGNGAPLVGILKNGNSASNGSIKRNGEVPLGQIDTRIEEVDEEENDADVIQQTPPPSQQSTTLTNSVKNDNEQQAKEDAHVNTKENESEPKTIVADKEQVEGQVTNFNESDKSLNKTLNEGRFYFFFYGI